MNSKTLKIVSCLIILLLSCANMMAEGLQSKGFTGTVYDENRDPLIGATVKVKGAQEGSITNVDGKFSINTTADQATLVVSYVGYMSQEVQATAGKSLDILMKEDATMLSETVVIGYGTTTKKEITGSVSSIKAEDFNKGVYSDALGMLQGKVAGLSIVKPGGADPMAKYEIILRGTNTLIGAQEPLIIVDGVVGEDIRNVNFEEVESMDVLKDGSAAAIYGTRGTNGVIIITTRRAKSGKATVEYSGRAIVQVAPRKVESLSASQFEDAIKTYAPDKAGSIYGAQTDWFDEITRTPFSHQHTVTIGGGTETLSHRTSFNLEESEGVLKRSDFNRYMFRTNINQKLFDDRLDLDLNATYSQRRYHKGNKDAFRQAFIYNPTAPIYNEDGSYYAVPNSGTDYYNPVAMVNERNADGKTNDFTGNVRATFKIMEGLNWVNFFTYSNSDWKDNDYRTSKYPSLTSTDDQGNVVRRNGEAQISHGSYQNKQYEMLLNYSKKINQHSIQAVAGYSYQEETNESTGLENSEFDTDAYGVHNIGGGDALKAGTAYMSSYRDKNVLVAFMGRVMYNFDERYLASVSLRREGSSRFGSNNKWGWFPAVSLGWRLNEEGFMKELGWFNDLKLRAGYGVTGNQMNESYRSLFLLSRGGYFYQNGKWTSSYKPDSNAEPNLKWEMKHEYNVGVDFSILGGRLDGTIDVYYRQVKDALYEYKVPTPPYLHPKKLTNIGEVSNRGVEITLGGIPVKTRDFEWSTRGVFSLNRNKLVNLSNSEFKTTEISTGWASGDIAVDTQKLIEGQAIGVFYGPVWVGTNELGQDMFKNQTPDGQVAGKDWEKIGTATPDYTLGWTNNMRYKDWGLSFALRASIGGDVLNSYRMYHENWTTIGRRNVVETQYTETSNYTGGAMYSSKYVEDATFLKLDNIALTYNVPIRWPYISKMQLSLTAQDVFCITKYKGLDPEAALKGLEPGIESLSYYPRTTSIIMGVNVTF